MPGMPNRDAGRLTEEQISSWALLERFLTLLDTYGASSCSPRREGHGLRELDRRAWFGLFLLGLFNPAIDSMRSLCRATRIQRVTQTLGRSKPVAISSFSDAQQVFSPEILEPVLQHLLAGSLKRAADVISGGRINPALIHILDSTLWKVVDRMAWADWRHQHCEQKAVRLHVKLRLADLQPATTELTTGKTCERAAMRRMIRPGEFYLGDRNYGADPRIFGELEEKGCGYVLRLLNVTRREPIECFPLSARDTAEGITFDGMMRLGSGGRGGLQRVVIVSRAGSKEDLILVTSESRGRLDAGEVAMLYRQRWQVEMFFRWLKCMVPCRHWFAESPRGVAVQIHLVLIKALLLAELTGMRPNKGMMEILRWHQMGIATDEELLSVLASEERAMRKRQVSKNN